MSKPTIARRVQRGAALLDKTNPKWFRKVRLPKLAMEGTKTCVLGQVYMQRIRVRRIYATGTAYSKGLLAVGLAEVNPDSSFPWIHVQEKDNKAAQYGFDLYDGESLSVWEKLTIAWVNEIKDRRKTVRNAA